MRDYRDYFESLVITHNPQHLDCLSLRERTAFADFRISLKKTAGLFKIAHSLQLSPGALTQERGRQSSILQAGWPTLLLFLSRSGTVGAPR